MYTKSDNVEIMSGTETSDAINELFNLSLEDIKKGYKQK